jgi:hypothetical protein
MALQHYRSHAMSTTEQLADSALSDAQTVEASVESQ